MAHVPLWCADEKAAAINDRIAWLERVINDRNMEVSLAGAPEPGDEAGPPDGDRPGAQPVGAAPFLTRLTHRCLCPHAIQLHARQSSIGRASMPH